MIKIKNTNVIKCIGILKQINGRILMKWNELFNEHLTPSWKDIKGYIGAAEANWNDLTEYIENTYEAKPKTEYSRCSLQPGWNVKYKKNGKALCTLYPMEDYFLALVVIGPKEQDEAEAAMEAGVFSPYVVELYRKTSVSAMGSWLMMEVKDNTILNDIKILMDMRVKAKKVS
jgi:hypothetical protein